MIDDKADNHDLTLLSDLHAAQSRINQAIQTLSARIGSANTGEAASRDLAIEADDDVANDADATKGSPTQAVAQPASPTQRSGFTSRIILTQVQFAACLEPKTNDATLLERTRNKLASSQFA